MYIYYIHVYIYIYETSKRFFEILWTPAASPNLISTEPSEPSELSPSADLSPSTGAEKPLGFWHILVIDLAMAMCIFWGIIESSSLWIFLD